MRGHALLGGLAALALAAWTSPRSERTREISRAGGRSGVATPLFQFLPASGAGAPVASDLCDAVTTDDKAGNWWCLKGDGTMATGSAVTLSAVGSPTTQTRPLCSNGLQCADATHGMTDGTSQYWATSSGVQSPTGDFSGCILAALWKGAVGDGNVLLSLDDNTAGNRVLLLNDAAQALVFKSDGTSSTTTKSLPGNRMRTLACFTYDYVADGSSVLTVYVDGVAGTPLNTAVGPPASTTGARWSVSARRKAGSADALKAIQHWGSFVTHKVLSAADVARLSTAVHGTLTGSRGEAVTFTRTSAQTCDNGSGAVTVLPSGRPCVAQGGYLSEGSATNAVVRSEEFDTWTASGDAAPRQPTVTANTVTGPDGTTTADTIVVKDTTGGASQYSVVTRTFTATAAAWTCSVYLKAASGTPTIYLNAWNGGTTFAQACTPTTSAWSRCELSNKTMTAASWNIQIGVDRTITGNDAQAEQTIYAWGAQCEAQAFASSYIRTEGSTATRNETRLYASGSLLSTIQAGAGSMCVRPITLNFATQNVTIDTREINTSNAPGWNILLNSATNTVFELADGTGTMFGTSRTYTAGDTLCAQASGTSVSTYSTTSGWATTSIARTSPAHTGLEIGGRSDAYSPLSAKGHIGRVCIDKRPTGCRP